MAGPDLPAGGTDEPVDPRALMQQQAQAIAVELLRTAELAPKLQWEEFDFAVDLFDPTCEDFAALLQAGERVNREAASLVLGQGIERHFTLPVRFRLIAEIGRRIGSDMRLDLREQGRSLMRALHNLSIPGRSVGLCLELYPRHLISRLQERQRLYGNENRDRSIDDDKFIESLVAGTGDLAKLSTMGDSVQGALEKALLSPDDRTPPKPVLIAMIAEAARRPGYRMARLLSALLFDQEDPDVLAAVRTALVAMPGPAGDCVDNHVAFHDPDAKARRALFSAMVDLKARSVLALMIEDAFGVGPWRQKGDADHAKIVIDLIVRHGDARCIPMAVHLLSMRPPAKALRAVIVDGLRAGPWKAEFDAALAALEEGRPVVVHRELDYEAFIHKFAKITNKMSQPLVQAEVARVSRLFNDCYHEELDWQTPKKVQEAIGTRERDLLRRLADETQRQLGRLAGHPQVAALESEFRTRWLTSPQNDISGRIPLAIMLDERAERDPGKAQDDREMQADELYGAAVRQHEGKVDEEAKGFLRAALQLVPGHAFAKDALERLERGEGIPGLDEGAAPEAAAPRIIIPE